VLSAAERMKSNFSLVFRVLAFFAHRENSKIKKRLLQPLCQTFFVRMYVHIYSILADK